MENRNYNGLSQDDLAELKKCQENPCYFYNKYVRPDGFPELTEEQYQEYVSGVDLVRLTMARGRPDNVNSRIMLPEQCFKS